MPEEEKGLHIRPIEEQDQSWVSKTLMERWGSTRMMSRGRLHDLMRLPGFIAELGSERLGLLTYYINGAECEVTSLDSLKEGQGIGAQLLLAVQEAAAEADCTRLWLITTNDNTPALRFYQKRGFQLAALYVGAVESARQTKPEIPFTGIDGIPIQDEIELELELT